jgi:GNAT superfamily N-acetyltransferase
MDAEMYARYGTPDAPEFTETVRTALAVDPADIAATVLALDERGTPVGHGALRRLDGDWEVKRLVVSTAQRGRGVGAGVMGELERIARDAGAERVILQTGDRQPEAVALYRRLGYTPIPVYGLYVEAIPHSFCFEKHL